jgi:hypothetical protein
MGERMIPATVGTGTRTDALIRVVASELERHRKELDQGDDTRVVSLVITLNQRTGYPMRVVYRTESQRDI